MPNSKIRIHDLKTDEIIDREMTDEELANQNNIKEMLQQEKAEFQAKAEAKLAIAERLGLTADELKLLLG